MVDIHSFAIQLPQRIVHKSTEEFFSSTITVDHINSNRTLPLGQSIWNILQSIQTEHLQSKLTPLETPDALDTTSSILPSPRQQGKRNLQNQSPAKPRLKRAKLTATGGKNTDSSSSSNLLLEVLKRINPEEIVQLRRNALSHSQTHYLFYAMNETVLIERNKSKLVHSYPPLTATNIFPTGGAIQTLETLLAQRKKEGIVSIGEACRVSSSNLKLCTGMLSYCVYVI